MIGYAIVKKNLYKKTYELKVWFFVDPNDLTRNTSKTEEKHDKNLKRKKREKKKRKENKGNNGARQEGGETKKNEGEETKKQEGGACSENKNNVLSCSLPNPCPSLRRRRFGGLLLQRRTEARPEHVHHHLHRVTLAEATRRRQALRGVVAAEDARPELKVDTHTHTQSGNEYKRCQKE